MKIRILRGKPVVAILATMNIDHDGVQRMGEYYRDRRPECIIVKEDEMSLATMLPHDEFDVPRSFEANDPRFTRDMTRKLSGNENLCELAGRSCYSSFGSKAGRKTNKEYLSHIIKVGHSSVIYHAKFTFFFAGISRRVSHELIRTYVGSDRTEDGSPSQESTRFTHHTGCYVEPPYINRIENEHDRELERAAFQESCGANYAAYTEFIGRRFSAYRSCNNGREPKGMARKRIYEAASSYLHHSCETSLVWTTNPAALFKQFMERVDKHADLEYRRFAAHMMKAAYDRCPNLFPAVVTEKLQWCDENGVFDL